MRALRIAVVVLVACGDDPATSSETGTNTSTTTAAAPTSATAETSDITTSSTAATTGDEVDPLAEYQPCGVGCGADQCITLDGASICGPGCFHFGPDRCD